MVAFSVLLTTPALAAEPRTKLTGWGPFQFSMSVAQAKDAAKGFRDSSDPTLLKYPCTVEGRSFEAWIQFTDDRQRIMYVNLIEDEGVHPEDPILISEYKRLIAVFQARYGDPDSVEPPVTYADRAYLHFGPEARAVFRFADGGKIEVLERTGYMASVIVSYKAAPPSEHF